MIAYVNPPSSVRAAGLVSRGASMEMEGHVVASLGDVDDDGVSDLVAWKTETQGWSSTSVVSVYRLHSDADPQEVARVDVPGAPQIPEDAQVLVGDIDPSLPGREIVVGGANLSGAAGRLCALGGLADGPLEVIADFAPLLRAAGREPFTIAVGDVVPDHEYAGQEIVVGGRAGRVYVFGLQHGRPQLIHAIRAFPDSAATSARRLAVGDLIPDRRGDEIAVGDDGTTGDGNVRIFDGNTRRPLLEFQAFPDQVTDGVELWIGDVFPDVPGEELIVGEGSAGGGLRVFSLASGSPRHLVDVPDPQQRATCLRDHVALGQFFVDRPGLNLAVAQSDASVPVQIFSFDSTDSYVDELQLPQGSGTISAIAGPK